MKTRLTHTIAGRMAIAGLCLLLAAGAILLTTSRTVSSEKSASPQAVLSSFEASYAAEANGEYAEAIDALVDAYNQTPGDYMINLRLGWLYYMNAEYDESASSYRAAIQAAPDAIEARVGYMLPLLAQQKYAEVEATAYKALKQDANNYFATLRLVTALRLEGKYDVAARAAREMLALYPSDVSFLAELATDEAALGNDKTARALCWKIRVLDPDNVTADYFLADAK